jgi:acetolactate synthase-1/2/3 large subunit
MLCDYEVKAIFGVPGDTNVALYTALAAAAGRIRHVMCRDERSAVFAADAYARLSGRPGVAECPSGAGSMYSLPGIAEAHESAVPVILITNDIPLTGEGRGMITELDNARLFEPITKLSVQIKSTNKIPETVRRAFRSATSGKPGAVQLTIPEDVFHHEIDLDKVSLHVESECDHYPAYRSRASGDGLNALARLISESERPLLVAGGGVNQSHAQSALQMFAAKARIPVVTTITGQGIMSDEHELAIGVIGDNGFHPHALRAAEQADLLVYVGCKMGSVATIGWTFPTKKHGRRIAQVDIDPAVLGNNSQNVLSIAGDARLVLEELLERCPDGSSTRQEWIDLLNRHRAEFWTLNAAQLASSESPIRPQRVVAELNKRLAKNAVILSDAGTATPYLTRFLRLEGGRSRLIIPRAFGGLGYAIPAVIGAWFARPDVRPIATFGDGSMGMTAGELETLARLHIPAVLIHFNNGCFGWIKALQRVRKCPEIFSVDFTPGDMAAVARAFGLQGFRVESADDLPVALDAAFACEGPAFIDVVCESIADVMPPVVSWMRASGKDPVEA